MVCKICATRLLLKPQLRIRISMSLKLETNFCMAKQTYELRTYSFQTCQTIKLVKLNKNSKSMPSKNA